MPTAVSKSMTNQQVTANSGLPILALMPLAPAPSHPNAEMAKIITNLLRNTNGRSWTIEDQRKKFRKNKLFLEQFKFGQQPATKTKNDPKKHYNSFSKYSQRGSSVEGTKSQTQVEGFIHCQASVMHRLLKNSPRPSKHGGPTVKMNNQETET